MKSWAQDEEQVGKQTGSRKTFSFLAVPRTPDRANLLSLPFHSYQGGTCTIFDYQRSLWSSLLLLWKLWQIITKDLFIEFIHANSHSNHFFINQLTLHADEVSARNCLVNTSGVHLRWALPVRISGVHFRFNKYQQLIWLYLLLIEFAHFPLNWPDKQYVRFKRSMSNSFSVKVENWKHSV